MAPFSVCSKCNVKTRKVVKDPITLKMIYLCPICFKNRNMQQKKPSPKDETIKKPEYEMIDLNISPTITIKDTFKKTETIKLENKQTRMEVIQPANENQSRPYVFKPPLPPTQRIRKLITPPVMQTVIINGRKYVAISETADD